MYIRKSTVQTFQIIEDLMFATTTEVFVQTTLVTDVFPVFKFSSTQAGCSMMTYILQTTDTEITQAITCIQPCKEVQIDASSPKQLSYQVYVVAGPGKFLLSGVRTINVVPNNLNLAISGAQQCNIEASDWDLVRETTSTSTWHPATDNLAGTDVYGT